MNFKPVSSLKDVGSLDEDEIVEGYRSVRQDDPEPGANRGRAFWHGWRMGMMDKGWLPRDNATRQLARELYQDQKKYRRRKDPHE